MITQRAGDLLEQSDLTHIAHQANLCHTFGAGLAAAIAKKFPSAPYADKKTEYGDESKLGEYTIGLGLGHPAIVNIYSQRGFGAGSTDYQAMERALRTLEANLRMVHRYKAVKLGLPFKLGCGLAGGDWSRVHRIIEDVFINSPIEVVICTRIEDREVAA